MMIRRYDQVDSTSEKLVFYTNYLIAYICKMQASALLLERRYKEKRSFELEKAKIKSNLPTLSELDIG